MYINSYTASFCIFSTDMECIRGCAKKKRNKSEITMEVGGWVQVSLGFFLFENHPK